MAQDYARPFYDSKQWRKTRKAYLNSQNYICEGCGGAASLVHHIKCIKPWNVANPDITLNWENLMALCDECHAEEHAQDEKHCGNPARLKGITFDAEGNAIKEPNAFLVCGSPGSGKTSYALEHKRANDLVVDLDYICAALMAEAGSVHIDHAPVLAVALEVRELLYQIIRARRGKWERAFVITSISNPLEMKAIANDLDAEIVFIDTSLEECLRRIRLDPSRGKQRKIYERLAVEWYENYQSAIDQRFIPPHTQL